MLYVLFFALIVLFMIGYYFTGKDILAPMTVQVITFLFVTLMCIYMQTYLKYKLHEQTVIIVITCLFASIMVGVAVHQLFLKIPMHKATYSDQKVSPITNLVHFFVILYLLAMLIWKWFIVQQLVSISDSNASIMNLFYKLSVTDARSGEKTLPIGLRQADHICDALFIIYGFNTIRFFKNMSKGQRVANIFIIGLCLFSCLMRTQRMAAIQNLIACVMIFHLLRIQKVGRYRIYSLKMIARLILLCCFTLFLFVQASNIVGRGPSKSSAARQLFMYTGAEIINFDMYLQNPGAHSEIFGKYTFYGIISALRSMGILKIPFYPHSDTFDFHSINGISLGNVYSFFKTYYVDFGVTGIYVLHLLASLAFSVSYEYTKKKLKNQHILLFSYMYCGIVLSFFSEYFYCRVFTLGYVENVFLILLFYNFFIKGNRLKFGLRRVCMNR